jgi:hypothetical protein|tara:strand:+ start:257 stop:517 length:261 start_codon:yes stop_codon:yes gene_type:complete
MKEKSFLKLILLIQIITLGMFVFVSASISDLVKTVSVSITEIEDKFAELGSVIPKIEQTSDLLISLNERLTILNRISEILSNLIGG